MDIGVTVGFILFPFTFYPLSVDPDTFAYLCTYQLDLRTLTRYAAVVYPYISLLPTRVIPCCLSFSPFGRCPFFTTSLISYRHLCGTYIHNIQSV